MLPLTDQLCMNSAKSSSFKTVAPAQGRGRVVTSGQPTLIHLVYCAPTNTFKQTKRYGSRMRPNIRYMESPHLHNIVRDHVPSREAKLVHADVDLVSLQ
jgi:hypothetical protein